MSVTNMEDLSRHHQPLSALFARSYGSADWEQYRLSDEQIEFFHENGYLKGVRILTDEQVEVLRTELDQLMDPAHPGRHLFHEYHSNESTDPNRVVFHGRRPGAAFDFSDRSYREAHSSYRQPAKRS